MAVGGSVCEFDLWLNSKLHDFNTDESVFGSYIRGILEGEETADEKKEALELILTEMTEDNITKLCEEIIDKWNLFKSDAANGPKSVLEVAEDVDVKLARLIESQAQATTVRNVNHTAEEKKIREAILLQYGQLSDDEGESEPHTSNGPPDSAKSGLERNTNASLVMQAEKEKREKAKMDSQKKKEKDREDREKQKQIQQEKKEKRKPQKGERRR